MFEQSRSFQPLDLDPVSKTSLHHPWSGLFLIRFDFGRWIKIQRLDYACPLPFINKSNRFCLNATVGVLVGTPLRHHRQSPLATKTLLLESPWILPEWSPSSFARDVIAIFFLPLAKPSFDHRQDRCRPTSPLAGAIARAREASLESLSLLSS